MNSEEYLSNVLRIIRENFRSNDPSGGMTVASAAYIVKQTIGSDHTVFGFAKFKDVLTELEKRGGIRTGSNSKNAFSLWLSGEPASHPTQVTGTRERFRPLRNQVWFAFVSAQPSGARYFNRATGEVRVGLESEPTDDGEWLEIEPIDAATEREIAHQFLKENGVEDSEVVSALDSERWYADFPKALAGRHPNFAFEWKRERSQRVIGVVRAWCRRHDVDERLVFDDSTYKPKQATQGTQSDENELHSLLLTAISRMSTEELLSLRLPAHQLVAVLRPDLLS